MTKNIVLKIIGLEVLLMVILPGNGAYSTFFITDARQSRCYKFIGLEPVFARVYFSYSYWKRRAWDYITFLGKTLTKKSDLFSFFSFI